MSLLLSLFRKQAWSRAGSFRLYGVIHATAPRDQCVRAQPLQSCKLSAAPRTVARQAPPSMGFFRQEHWSGLPFPPPGDLPHPGIEPSSLASPALALYH